MIGSEDKPRKGAKEQQSSNTELHGQVPEQQTDLGAHAIGRPF